MMTKKTLRKQFKSLRQALPAPQYVYDGWAITARLLQAVNWQDFHALHVYLPMIDRRELNTYPLIQALWRAYPSLKICVPRVNLDTQLIENLLFTPDTHLVVESFGQCEPAAPLAYPAELVDIVLVPLLAYDRAGYRVGYGKGYYDRFLPTCAPNALKIGISQFAPVECIADIDAYDIPLDKVFTPYSVETFRSR